MTADVNDIPDKRKSNRVTINKQFDSFDQYVREDVTHVSGDGVFIKSDEPLLVTGTVQINNRDEEAPSAELIVEEIHSLKEVRERRVKRFELRLRAEMVTDQRLSDLTELARKHVGATPVAVSIVLPGEAEATVSGTSLKVMVSDELIEAVDKLFGSKVAELA